jgi:hypothetical protein
MTMMATLVAVGAPRPILTSYFMRCLLFAAVSAVAVLTAAGSNPAAAQGYPYCLKGGDWGWPGLCQFSTYQQCLATASGTRSYCGIDPYYAFARQRQGYWPRY